MISFKCSWCSTLKRCSYSTRLLLIDLDLAEPTNMSTTYCLFVVQPIQVIALWDRTIKIDGRATTKKWEWSIHKIGFPYANTVAFFVCSIHCQRMPIRWRTSLSFLLLWPSQMILPLSNSCKNWVVEITRYSNTLASTWWYTWTIFESELSLQILHFRGFV